jgi:hypothetical protein
VINTAKETSDNYLCNNEICFCYLLVYQIAHTRGRIPAKQIQRETGVTYKTAWHICNLVRRILDEDHPPFSCEVELNETYVGGKMYNGMRGRASENTPPVIGAVQHGGNKRLSLFPKPKLKRFCPM